MTSLNSDCARKWWMISAAAGVVVAFVVGAILGVGLFASILLGAIVGGVMGYITVRTQCDEADVETARPQDPAPTTSPRATPSAGSPTGSAPSAGSATGSAPSAGSPTGSAPSAGSPAGSAPSAGANTAGNADSAGRPAPSSDPAPQGFGTSPGASAGGAASGVAQPRGGQPDDLKQIRGLGPKFEEKLNELGIYRFDQIAAWGDGDVARVEEQLNVSGRVAREDWIAQARRLAAGDAN